MNEQDADDLYGGDETPAQRVGNGPESKASPSKLENVAALGKNKKTSRVIIATVGAVLLVGGIATVSIISKNNRVEKPQPTELTGAAVGNAPPLSEERSTALADSEQYRTIVAAAGQDRADAARQSGESTQPLATTVEASLKPKPTPAEAAAAAAEAEQLRLQQQAMEQARQQAAAQPSQQQGYPQSSPQGDQVYQQQIANAQSAMTQLMAPRTRGLQVFALADSTTASVGSMQQVGLHVGGAGQAGTGVGGGTAGGAAVAPSVSQVTLIGAGVIESARMDMGANTDVGGDFVATLLTGKWAGAKLIGSVQRRGELAALTVRTLSLQAQGVSVSANAIILDPETAEGGTATDVDRKLFVKYGVKPLAAGFAAVADYLKGSGTTVMVNGETVTSSQPELTNKKAAQIVAGSAAQQVSTDADALDTTPTVRVRRGAIVGVFFTQDVLYAPKQ